MPPARPKIIPSLQEMLDTRVDIPTIENYGYPLPDRAGVDMDNIKSILRKVRLDIRLGGKCRNRDPIESVQARNGIDAFSSHMQRMRLIAQMLQDFVTQDCGRWWILRSCSHNNW